VSDGPFGRGFFAFFWRFIAFSSGSGVISQSVNPFFQYHSPTSHRRLLQGRITQLIEFHFHCILS
jgi:hypothetical protein